MSSSAIRPLEAEDLPRVAQIINTAFRGGRGEIPDSLLATLRELFWDHPHHDPETRSLVHTRDGGIVDGFIGALPQPMVFRGEPLRGVASAALVVENPELSPTAGGFLMRRLLNGPQDITMTDTANRRSLDIQRALRCHPVLLPSLQWTKILRPAGSVMSIVRGRIGPLNRLPFGYPAQALDAVLGSRSGLYHRPSASDDGWTDADVSHEVFADIFLELTEKFQLRPGWTRADLVWLLGQASQKSRFGTLFVRAVHGKRGEPIGAYLYFGQPHEKGVVLQIVTRKGSAEQVLASLFDHALGQRCPMVRGPAHALLMEGLFRHRGIFFRHEAGTSIRTRVPTLVEALRADDVLLGGIAGERWTRLV